MTETTYQPKIEKSKIVLTKDSNNNKNGFLIELKKTGKFTETYLTACDPNTIKGYHLHRVREANYTCVRGTVDIDLFFLHDNIVSQSII